MSIFEAAMLVCFGAAWPLNIYKSWKTRSAVGKSVFFLYVVSLGYVAGIVHKLLYNQDLVLYLYIINLGMVLTDTALYYRNKKLDSLPGPASCVSRQQLLLKNDESPASQNGAVAR